MRFTIVFTALDHAVGGLGKMLSRARHNPHEIGVRAMYIPHPPSPTGPFIFPMFSEIGPPIFPTC